MINPTKADYQSICQEIRLVSSGQIIFTNGCFDVLHLGHLSVLSHCFGLKKNGGTVVVGLNSDSSVQRQKGPDRPIQDEHTRAMILFSLKYVDHVIVFDESTPAELISVLKPDVIVKGGDYDPSTVVGREVAPISIAPLVQGQSTTDLIRRIRG